ncbi:MAG: hypothetical protein WKG07_15815 [Hymenobacter sp.]
MITFVIPGPPLALLLLLLALLSFEACWLTNTRVQLNDGGAAYPNVARLQGLVNQATTTAGREAQRVALESQAPTPDFGRLLAQCSYPTFVARDGELWAGRPPVLRPPPPS